MIKRVLPIIIGCVVSVASLPAQEGLKPLGARINRLERELKERRETNVNSAARTQTTALLQIPFLDDFHYSTTSVYPDSRLWLDSTAYVNYGMPTAPPSIGVATFDGLNKHGYPYQPGLTNFLSSNAADTLTSRPIDLHVVAATTQTLLPSDSVALSFYYQARGHGETPEDIDSLLLDFYKPRQKLWVNVWGVPGNFNGNVNDTVFKRAMVWLHDTVHTSVGDTAYLTEGFQFRFRNKATVNGDFDHWHLDYVYLNKNRSVFDTVLNDLTIEAPPTSYLKNYTSMPFRQFDASEMAERTSVRIRCNTAPTNSVNMTYENRTFTYPGHILLSNYTGGSNIQPPYVPYGLSTYANHANPPITYTFTSPMTDFTYFEIQHYVYRSTNASADFSLANDTVSQRVDFGNYFALDDGAAEAGYYILGEGAKMAMKVRLNVPDTLTSLRIYFDPDGQGYSTQDTITYRFSMNVWADGGSGPGSLVYTDARLRRSQYLNGDFKTFPEYRLSAPLKLNAGVYYIGIQQKIATGLTIGFDVNQDHHDNFYYDSGNGWTQSGFHGSPMIHPVFGTMSPPVGIKENKGGNNWSAVIYPNPSSGNFTIAADGFESCSYKLVNMLGQQMAEGALLQKEQAVSTNGLEDGIYFLVISKGGRLLQQQKIIIQH